jgi:hypothetical protein
MEDSFGGLSGRIIRYRQHGQYAQAAEVALYGMRIHRGKENIVMSPLDHHNWWGLASDGLRCVRDGGVDELYPEYAKAVLGGPQPLQGIYVAMSLLQLSRWHFQSGRHEEAKMLARSASEADMHWAEPEFILGWYALTLKESGAEGHLESALARDIRMLKRIINDPVCAAHADLVARVTREYTVQPSVGGSNHSLNPDGPDGPRD